MDLEVVVSRGAIEESRHRIHFALCDADGTLREGSASPHLVTTFRSAAKPFQLLPLVERGHADRFGFDDEQLAVMASSHTGSREHLRLVAGILERIGLGPGALACGYHEPEDPESRDALFRGSAARSPMYNNCSGKHAGLLALVVAEGWPLEGYHRLGHPLQQLLLETVADVCGVRPASVETAVDGCSLVVFALPISAMARAYARLGGAAAPGGGDARRRAMGRIARAMAAHPRAVEGRGRVSTALMEATSGRLVAKGGAEALQLVADRASGLGLAIKCEDGASRAVGPALITLLEHIGALSGDEAGRLASIRGPVLTNAAGLEVGRIEARIGAHASA